MLISNSIHRKYTLYITGNDRDRYTLKAILHKGKIYTPNASGGLGYCARYARSVIENNRKCEVSDNKLISILYGRERAA